MAGSVKSAAASRASRAPIQQPAKSLATLIFWIFRFAVAAEFIGHGAFGVITKEAWVPYFAVAGIGREMAYRLMPLIGAVDILLGITMFLSPRRVGLLYMAIWGLWTACLRPLSGDSVWELVERSYNYFVPLAFLMFVGWGTTWKSWFEPIEQPTAETGTLRSIAGLLRWTIALGLFGHGFLGALNRKAGLIGHYDAAGLSALGLPLPELTMWIGWFEVGLGLLVLMRPMGWLLVFVMSWKMATEALHSVKGLPIWEFIERGGAYAAPLILLLITRSRRVSVSAFDESSPQIQPELAEPTPQV